MGDADYIFAFQHIVMPVGVEFKPDLVISKCRPMEVPASPVADSAVAAGFDAAEGDQLGGCFVTPDCYAHMTHMLMSLAEGKVVACLEVKTSTCLYANRSDENGRVVTTSKRSLCLLWRSLRP